jgi:hypothetical protein
MLRSARLQALPNLDEILDPAVDPILMSFGVYSTYIVYVHVCTCFN